MNGHGEIKIKKKDLDCNRKTGLGSLILQSHFLHLQNGNLYMDSVRTGNDQRLGTVPHTRQCSLSGCYYGCDSHCVSRSSYKAS